MEVTVGPSYLTARDLFESAREASRDAERIRRQLLSMESAAEGLGGSGFEPRVASTGEPDRMAARVAAMVDRESMLAARLEGDYALIDRACEVLYGEDGRGGLWSLVGWRADAIWHHYLGGRTWAEVAALLGYGERHVREQAMAALDVCDGWGLASVAGGSGGAEG